MGGGDEATTLPMRPFGVLGRPVCMYVSAEATVQLRALKYLLSVAFIYLFMDDSFCYPLSMHVDEAST